MEDAYLIKVIDSYGADIDITVNRLVKRRRKWLNQEML